MRRRPLAVTCALALSCLIRSAPLTAQQTFDQAYEGARTPRNASYDISVRLDPAAASLRGIEIIRWRNISNQYTRELRLHVPPRVTITRLEAKQPDGRTVALPTGTGGVRHAPLPWEVVPLETVEVYVEWHARAAPAGTFAMPRWFPRMAVLEDDGWNTTVTSSDYGSYDVQITLPPDLDVTATGFEAYRLDNGDGSVTHRYRAEDVRDFVWTASRRLSGPRPWLLVPVVQVVASFAMAIAWRRRRA